MLWFKFIPGLHFISQGARKVIFTACHLGKLKLAFTSQTSFQPSSETQGQIVGVRESLNRRENMAQKKSKLWPEEPLGTMSYQTSSKRSPLFWLLIGARKLLCFSAQSEARTAATVWNWSGKTLSPGALLAVLYFSSCLIFPPVQTYLSPHYLPLGLRGCIST